MLDLGYFKATKLCVSRLPTIGCSPFKPASVPKKVLESVLHKAVLPTPVGPQNMNLRLCRLCFLEDFFVLIKGLFVYSHVFPNNAFQQGSTTNSPYAEPLPPKSLSLNLKEKKNQKNFLVKTTERSIHPQEHSPWWPICFTQTDPTEQTGPAMGLAGFRSPARALRRARETLPTALEAEEMG